MAADGDQAMEFRPALDRLAEVTLDVAEKHKGSGAWTEEDFVTYRVEVTDLQYTGSGVGGFSSRAVPTTRTRLASSSSIAVVGEVSASAEFQRATQLLENFASRGTVGPHFVIQRLVQGMVATSPHEASELCARLVDDVSGTRPWRVRAFLTGLVPSAAQLEMSPGLKLRRVTAEDLAYEVAPETLVHGTGSRQSWGFSTPSAVLECEMEAAGQAEVDRAVDRAELALRLLKLGSVIELSREIGSESLLDFGGTTWRHRGQTHAAYTATLEREDEATIGPILRTLHGAAPHPSVQTALGIALEHFEAGVLGGGSPSSRSASAIAALEALFSESNQDLKRLLAQRATLTISMLGGDPRTLYDSLRAAYDVGSRFSHGLRERIAADRLTETCALALDCARLALIMFQQLPPTLAREAFLREIDLALLDGSTRHELSRLIGAQIRTAVPGFVRGKL